MPIRIAVPALALALPLVLALTGAASCPPAGRASAAAWETCADRAAGAERAIYLARAASEWRKAAVAGGRRTAEARRRLAHAMVLDERVQDDPAASLALRMQAKHDEELARAALNNR